MPAKGRYVLFQQTALLKTLCFFFFFSQWQVIFFKLCKWNKRISSLLISIYIFCSCNFKYWPLSGSLHFPVLQNVAQTVQITDPDSLNRIVTLMFNVFSSQHFFRIITRLYCETPFVMYIWTKAVRTNLVHWARELRVHNS